MKVYMVELTEPSSDTGFIALHYTLTRELAEKRIREHKAENRYLDKHYHIIEIDVEEV